MTVADVKAMVEVHLASFSGFFLSFLGPAFLHELYAAIVADPTGIAYVWEDDGVLQGFVAGTSYASGFYRRLLERRWWRFCRASILPVIKNPRIIPRLLRAFSKPNESTETNQATLMSIAVLPMSQGKGIARALIDQFLREAARSGCKQVSLTTDKDHNDYANIFYQRLGFVCKGNFFTPEGREMVEYVIHI